MKLQSFVRLASLAAVMLTAAPSIASIDPAEARQLFEAADAACLRDGGKLWGRSLCGRILLVDAGSREAVASVADREGSLTGEKGVFIGAVPRTLPLANTAVEWNGEVWAMVLWPISDEPAERLRVALHELWHTHQVALGFPSTGPANAHLDTVDGRTLMRLEMRALGSALRECGAARRAAIADALGLRARRHALVRGAAEEERLLEMHEGLAEYSAIRLTWPTSPAARDRAAAKRLAELEAAPTFARSFAYGTGAAWALLLDHEAREWRVGLAGADDLTLLMAKRVKASKRARNLYDEKVVAEEERSRAEARAKRLQAYEQRYVAGPLLVFPLRQMQMQFDPNKLEAFPDHGTVYEVITVSDAWGSVRVTGGALLSNDFTKLVVPASPNGEATGNGWAAELRDGWVIRRDANGSMTVELATKP